MKSTSFTMAGAGPLAAMLFLLLLTGPFAGGQNASTVLLGPQILPVQAGHATVAQAQIISLDPAEGADLQAHLYDGKGNRLPDTPPNFRRLGEATLGQQASLRMLTLRFAKAATITGLDITRDFQIEGGTCAKGSSYQGGSTCTLLVRFTPQGPGNRLGHLTITHTGSATPDSIGLGGYGSAPVLSFVPSVIQTVPGTYPSNVGLLNGAQNLATDGGDRLFVADTNNAVLRMIDSTGTIDKYSGSYVLPPPLGITVDNLGQVWFTVTDDSQMYTMPNPSLAETWGFSYTDTCSAATSPCLLAGETLYSPGELSADSSNNIFFSETALGAAMSNTQPDPSLLRLNSAYAFSSRRFATDSYDDLYSFDGSYCRIMGQTLYDAEHDSPSIYRVIAGSAICGFSGDGGDARNAEIGGALGQFAFDAAGDLYFTDSNNQRVRRVDYNTGIIRTIAGNGAAGYSGDGGPAKSAALSNPTGLAVDSQGQVYIISGDGSPGTTQVIRKVTTQGILAFGSQVRSTPSKANIVQVTNTGNSAMVLAHFGITGTNAADFTIDPITTSCGQAKSDTLAPGATCSIGVIFTPPTTGARTARIVLTDNTVTGSNTILLNGTGVLPTPSLKITAPTQGQSFKTGTPFTVTATVTSASGPAPTGQVQFRHDGVNFGSPVTLSSGTASINMTLQMVTTHYVGATYLGDANYAPAGPVVVSITVTNVLKLPTTVSLSPMMTGAANRTSMAFAVSAASDGDALPGGAVQLREAGKVLASGWLSNGMVLVTSPPLAQGIHALTAYYEGDALHLPGVSPTVIEIVTPAETCSEPMPMRTP